MSASQKIEGGNKIQGCVEDVKYFQGTQRKPVWLGQWEWETKLEVRTDAKSQEVTEAAWRMTNMYQCGNDVVIFFHVNSCV